jgi:hypothetical protein
MADSALNRLAAITARTPELARILRERLPRFVAPFQNPIVGDDGTVWLPRNVAAGEPATFLVFTPRGDLRGEVAMPRPRMRATFVTSSDALALETTDDGFVDVLLLRVEVGAR